MIERFLESGVDKKNTLYSIKLLYSFLGVDNLNDWVMINRQLIHDMNGDNCFRLWIEKKVKSVGTRNIVLRQLERLFDFLIMEHASEKGEILENPFCLHFDKFIEEKFGGTKRKAINYDVIELLKNELIEDDFKFVKDLRQDFIDGEFNPSRAIMLYMMLCLPLRSMQIRFLDKDLVLQEKNMDGLSGRKIRGIFINTNKNSKGYFIPKVDDELLRLIKRQIDFRQDDIVIDKIHGLKDSIRVNLLFVNNYGEVVSREKLMQLWKKLCKEVYYRYGVKVDCDLHSLRVSLVSHAMNVIGDDNIVGNYLSGQTSDIVGHYYRVEDIEEKIRSKEKDKNIGKLLGNIKLLE